MMLNFFSDVQDMRVKDEVKGNRRGKPQIEIYRPGSGPLRKSAPGDEETAFLDNGRRAKSPIENSVSSSVSEDFKRGGKKLTNSLPQDHLSNNSKRSNDMKEPSDASRHSRGVPDIEDRLKNAHLSLPGSSFKDQRNNGDYVSPGGSSRSVASDTKRRSRKPEQAIYIPKPLAQAIAERDVANRSPVNMTEGRIVNNVSCSKEKIPFQDERWDENTGHSHSDNTNRELQSQRSEVCDRNGGHRVNKGESCRRMKYEGNKKSGRGSGDNEWVEKDVGTGIVKQGGVTNSKSNECKPHSMRYSGNRKNSQPVEGDTKHQEENHTLCWSSESSTSAPSYSQRRTDASRVIRQASEPRALLPASLPQDTNRMRDTRSVEPVGTPGTRGWNGGKLQAKPPSGRRGSVKDCNVLPSGNKSNPKPHPCYDSLPPRLKKKYLAENMVSSSTYIGTTSEDVWDGSTVTFQGSGSNYHQHHHQQRHAPQHQVLPHHPTPPHLLPQNREASSHVSQYDSQEHWAHTLPNSRARGRGRLRPDEMEKEGMVAGAARFSRSLTPDRLSMTAASNVDPPSSGHGFERVPSHESLLPSDDRKGIGNRIKTPPAPPPPPPPSTSALSTSKGPPQDDRRGTSNKPSNPHSARYR
jgi:hypothetical protein